MKRRHLMALILTLFTGRTITVKSVESIPCPWPGCRKKGKILDGDIMTSWYKNGKVLTIHAFHILEEYGPKWTPK